tara:strand:+ start:84 stop:995 length:912 start_codon:yes stop_codon:yes gene_type:complete
MPAARGIETLASNTSNGLTPRGQAELDAFNEQYPNGYDPFSGSDFGFGSGSEGENGSSTSTLGNGYTPSNLGTFGAVNLSDRELDEAADVLNIPVDGDYTQQELDAVAQAINDNVMTTGQIARQFNVDEQYVIDNMRVINQGRDSARFTADILNIPVDGDYTQQEIDAVARAINDGLMTTGQIARQFNVDEQYVIDNMRVINQGRDSGGSSGQRTYQQGVDDERARNQRASGQNNDTGRRSAPAIQGAAVADLGPRVARNLDVSAATNYGLTGASGAQPGNYVNPFERPETQQGIGSLGGGGV